MVVLNSDLRQPVFEEAFLSLVDLGCGDSPPYPSDGMTSDIFIF
jgi:hypothetical protein